MKLPTLLLLSLFLSLTLVAQVSVYHATFTTLVPGIRKPEGKQTPATIQFTADVENTTAETIEGVLLYKTAGKQIAADVTLPANKKQTVALPDFVLDNPKLWWPNGFGDQPLYDVTIQFKTRNKTVYEDQQTLAIRSVKTTVNKDQQREVTVNGQKIFIKGIYSELPQNANYNTILQQYHDANLNAVLLNGNRPNEFFNACDKYGLLDGTRFKLDSIKSAALIEEAFANRHYVQPYHPQVRKLDTYCEQRKLVEKQLTQMWVPGTGFILSGAQTFDITGEREEGLAALAEACKPLHIIYSPDDHTVRIANTTSKPFSKMAMWVVMYNSKGEDADLLSGFMEVPPGTCNVYGNMNNTIDMLSRDEGMLLHLRLADAATGEIADENMYWMPDSSGVYSGLAAMGKANISAVATMVSPGLVAVTITNPPDGPVAFFNKIALVNGVTKKSILPVFCNNNYISVLPGQQRTVQVAFTPPQDADPLVTIEGWNVDKKTIEIKKSAR